MPTSYTADLPNDILIDSATLYADLGDGLIDSASLAIDAVPEKFKTTSTATYRINNAVFEKAPQTAIVFSAAHVVSLTKFGVILVQVNAAGTISTKVPLATQAYNTAPLALAALPAPDADNIALGYIAIEADAGAWTANTDDLTNGSDLTTASFNNDASSEMVILGGTRGGLTFDPGSEWRQVPFDGSRGPVAGLDRKTNSAPKITGTLLLFGPRAISQILEPGADVDDTGTNPSATRTITPYAPGAMLPANSYHRYELLYDRGNGGTAKIIFPLGLNVGWTLSGQDNNEGEIPITIEARQDPAVVLASGAYIPFSIELTGTDIPSAA